MKARLREYEDCISIRLQPETLEEAAIITLAGMNTTKELLGCSTYVFPNNFELNVAIAKHRKSSGSVPKRSK